MYSTTEAAYFLGIKFYRILYAHKAGHVEEPERLGGNRAYTQQEVLKLAEHFGIPQEDVLQKMNVGQGATIDHHNE